MKKIYLNIYKPTSINLKKAKHILENNNIISIPTETVYGLAGNAFSDKAVKKIYKLKKRPYFNPLIIHYKNLEDLKKDAFINNFFTKLYKKFCPGPITFILNKKEKSKISKFATAKKKTIAVRFPNHKCTIKLLKIMKVPLAAPSANISTQISPTSAIDVFDEFKNKIRFILDGGKCKIGLESTIIDLTKTPSILRPGAIDKKQIEKILKRKVIVKKKKKNINAPGQLKLHYSPGIPVNMNKKLPKNKEAFISFGGKSNKNNNYFNLSKNKNINEAANNLYKILRKIKKSKFKSISVVKIPNNGIGYAINDRLKRASKK